MTDVAGLGEFLGRWAAARALEEDTRRRLRALEEDTRRRLLALQTGDPPRAVVLPSPSHATPRPITQDFRDEVSGPRSDRAEAVGRALGYLALGAVVGLLAKEKLEGLIKPHEP
jgi:hypothetical protein